MMGVILKTVFTLLVAALSSGVAFAQSVDPNKLVDGPDDNPPNWCRNGQFPAMADDYRVARIVRATERQDGDDGCPSVEAGRCKPDKTLEPGAIVAVSKTYGDFSCTFDARDQSSGWVPTADISPLPARKTTRKDWSGVWTDGYSGIAIKAVTGGLHVSASAEWKGATSPMANRSPITAISILLPSPTALA